MHIVVLSKSVNSVLFTPSPYQELAEQYDNKACQIENKCVYLRVKGTPRGIVKCHKNVIFTNLYFYVTNSPDN